jgi:hypothetical protein
VLRLLAAGPAAEARVRRALGRPDAAEVIAGLLKDGLVARRRGRLALP